MSTSFRRMTDQHQRPGDRKIHQRQRQHDLPAEGHKLIEPQAWERGPQQDKQTNEQEGLDQNQTAGGSQGPCQPPKNSTVIMAEIRMTPRYSPTKNMPNFMPEYSV